MSKAIFSNEKFGKIPIVGIIRGNTFEEIKEILPVFIDAGLSTIEITLNTPAATEIIRYATEQYAGELNIGAGTVCSEDDLERALGAGAQFIVTPIINDAVIKSCVKAGIPIFPGAFTPTEIYQAWELGATMVKVYPATSLGASYIKDVKAPLDKIKLLPTGGVNKDNLAEFMKAGADGLGIGGQLFHKQHIADKNWAALKVHFEAFSGYFI